MFGAISEKFRAFTCGLNLRFPQFFTFYGGWGNSFSLYQSCEISITLSISSLGKSKTFYAFHDSSYNVSRFFTFAGTPAAMQLSGISEQTTEPAAITLLLPIRHPGRTITPAPIQTLSPIRIS